MMFLYGFVVVFLMISVELFIFTKHPMFKWISLTLFLTSLILIGYIGCKFLGACHG